MAKMRFDERMPHPSAKSDAAGRKALSRLYGAPSLAPEAHDPEAGQTGAGAEPPNRGPLTPVLLLAGLVVVVVVVAVTLFS